MNFIHNAHMVLYPPFDALIAFEAAVRHGNMTLAADELNITQSAVSHRVRRLEEFMGVPLLIRLNAGLEVTPAGQAVLFGLTDVLEGLADLRPRCVAVSSDQLRIGVGAGLAENWLVRRIPDFTSRFPDISLELAIVENEAPERMGDLDIRILWLPPDDIRPSSTQAQLFRENVFPVCNPSILPENFDPSEALTTLPLLYKGPPGYHASEEWSWTFWFKLLGVTKHPKPSIRFASIGPSIKAAIEGAGVAIARSMLVQDALADGRLVRILPPSEDQLSSKVHVVRWPARLSGDERVKHFVSWLVEKSHETGSNLST